MIIHPQKFGCTPKNEGKGVHVPPDEKTCGHAGLYWVNLALAWFELTTAIWSWLHVHMTSISPYFQGKKDFQYGNL
jgi:hypothetical protein